MATGELVPLVLAGDLAAIQALYEEKGELIELNSEEVEYTEDGIERVLNKPIIVAAIEQGNLEIIKLLLTKGADINKYYKGIQPPGPIFFITEYSNPKVSEDIAFLIFEHSNLSLKNSKGQTILYEAQVRSAEFATGIIKKFGVNIAERDLLGHTVVDEVLFHDMYQLMPVYQQYVLGLIQADDVNTLRHLVLDGFEYVLQGGGVSAQDIAAQSEANEVAEFLGTVPQIMDTIPTLHSAVSAGNLAGVQAIITPDLSRAKDSGGRCSLHHALISEQEPVARYLTENFPDTLKVTDVYQRCPLHYAAALANGDSYYDMMVAAGAVENAADCMNLTPKDYRSEFANPGSRAPPDVDIRNMIEKERTTKYGVRVYLKLQYHAILQTIEDNNTQAAQELIDNLAGSIEDFITEGVANIPLLFLCVEKGAEDIALYLLTKGADPSIKYNGTTLQDAAFKANMGGLYHVLADALGFKARRLSAFSETSSMMSENVSMPTRPPPAESRPPAGLTGFDSQYLGRVLGSALTTVLAEVCERRPWDPIEFMGQWLYTYAANQVEEEKKKEEQFEMTVQRAVANKDEIRQKRQKKEAKHLQKLEEERRSRMEEEERLKAEEELKRKELEELRNKQRESDQLAQPPDLDTVREDDEPAAATQASDEPGDDSSDTQQESSEGGAGQQDSSEGQQEEQSSGGGGEEEQNEQSAAPEEEE